MIKRLTVTGFKSFAKQTSLEFTAGLTAVVGPNGSGKSNLADAMRWVMGEQSKAKLRLDERDDIIFAGADGRPRAGVAEVTMVLSGLPESLMQGRAELAITRKLYRDGGSQYLVSGQVVKLADLQVLLAAAAISAGGYSVIGQGAIDELLMASPSDRKSLFADAAGIREPELSRASALRQLEQARQNCDRLQDIATELEPRLQSLAKTVAAAQAAVNLQSQRATLRQQLVDARTVAATTALREARQRQTELQQAQQSLEQSIAQTEAQLVAGRRHRQEIASRRDQLEADIAASLSKQRSQMAQVHETKLKLEATQQYLAALEDVRKAQKTLEQKQAAAKQLLESLRADQAAAQAAATRAADTLVETAQSVAAAQEILKKLRRSQAEGTRDQYVNHALDVMRTLASGLHKRDLPADQVKLLVHKAGRLLSHAASRQSGSIIAQLQAAQTTLETAMHRRETATEHQTNITITLRSLEIDLKHQTELVKQYQAELTQLEETQTKLQSQTEKLDQYTRHHTEATRRLAQFDEELKALRTKLATPDSLNDDQAETTAAVALAKLEGRLQTVSASLPAVATSFAQAEQDLADARVLAASWGLRLNSEAEPADAAAIATELTATEAKLEALVQISSDRQAEYEEVSTRYHQLTGQITDLTQAQSDLTKLIDRLDGLIRRRFQQNFGVLADQFALTCQKLLSGSQGRLSLKADGADYGVDITVAPRGGRPVGIQALSGGERTLAGIALLGAIIQTNPSPFVVLDEIDAALDETNSGVVATMLEELATHSQVIIVTHNRQTMQAANTLYGVTLTGTHLSTVVSMRLEQATALAAR